MEFELDNFEPVPISENDNTPTEMRCYVAGENALGWIRDIGRNQITPSYLLERLSTSTDPELRIAIADHQNTPLAVLMLLADDPDADVRMALAENHNINQDVLCKLLQDANPYVVNRAQRTVSRINLDTKLMHTWLQAHASPFQ